MPDIIITPSTGKLEFVDNSSQNIRKHAFSMDDDDGIKIDAPFRASSVRAPLNIINVNVDNSNTNYPFVLASGSAETGIKTLMMDGSGGTYNPFTNTATIDISGNSATTTLASNSTNLGGVAAASYVTLTGTQTLTNKTITGTFTGNLTGTGSWATNAVNANTATNSTQLNGQSDSYYTNIPARLGYTPVNKAGDTVTGNLIINGNFTVNGATTLFSASNVYISSSQLYIEDNILTLNAFSPYLRYAGVEMYDSGSGTLSSLLWDGEADYFFLTGSSVNGKIITGPDGQTNLSSNFVPKATAGNKLGNSLIYDNGTNVGIGTTLPASRLHVDKSSQTLGSSTPSGATIISNLAGHNAILELGVDTTNFSYIQSRNVTDQTYYKLLLNPSGGSVGIGTTVPAYKLEVYSGAKTSAFTGLSISNFNNYDGTAASLVTSQLRFAILENDTGTYNAPARTFAILESGNEVNNSSSDGFFAISTRFNGAVAQKFRITAAGNVGIGTTAPQYPLDISGSNIRSFSTAGGAEPGFIADYPSSNGYGGFFIHVNNTRRWRIGSVGDTNVQPALNFWQEGTGSRMIITNTGNVGIGTTSPNAKLGVIGSIVAADTITATNTLYIQKGVGGYLSYITAEQTAASTGNSFKFWNSGGSTLMTIGYDGNVGIGTTLPTSKLHIVETTATGSRIQLGSTSTNALMNTNLVNDFLIFTAPFNAVPATVSNNNAKWGIKMGGGSTDAPNTSGKSACIYAVSEEDIGAGGSGAGYNRKVGLALHTSPFDLPNVERVRINNLGNVGIGSTSPAAKLDIVGTNSTIALSFGTTVPNNPLFINTYAGSMGIGMDQATAGIRLAGDYSGGSNPLVDIGYYSGGTVSHANWISKFKILNSGVTNFAANVYHSIGGQKFFAGSGGTHAYIYTGTTAFNFINSSDSSTLVTILNGGNVGIGTTSPTDKLSVIVSAPATLASTSDGLRITDGTRNVQLSRLGSTYSYAGVAGSGSMLYSYDKLNIVADTSNPIIFNTGGSERVRIDSGGSVGIGTASPTTKLDVFVNGGEGLPSVVTGERMRIISNDVIGRSGFLSIIAGSSAYSGVFFGDKDAADVGKIRYYHTDNSLQFLVNGSTEKMRIASDGNVGIGTTSPIAMVHIESSNSQGDNKGLIYLKSTSGTNVLKIGVDGTNNFSELRAYNPGAGDNSKLILQPYGGNVGIGTTSPSGKLEVVGNFVINGASNSNIAQQVFTRTDVSWGIFNETDLRFYSSNSNTTSPSTLRMTIASTGNVGIGTSSPSAKLDIRQTSTAVTALKVFTNDVSTAYIAQFIGYDNSLGDTTRMVIQGGGNVGIGTTTPATLLNVSSANADGGKILIQSGTLTNNNRAALFMSAINVNGQVGNVSIECIHPNNQQSDMVFRTGATDTISFGTERMRINTTGNVGIGRTDPAYKLDVSTSIVSRSNISTPRFSSAGGYVYGITNSPSWNQSCGTYTNNNATAPDGTTSAGTYTLNSTCASYDLYQTISSLTVGRVYTIGMWVKLGTATNFCLVVNNSLGWNTIGGKAFTSSDGLSTGKWTHISFTFTQPAGSNQINLHLGYHAETAVTQQTAGTVFLWNIEMTEFSSTWIGNVEDEIRLPGSSIWTSRGNVGIGTTSPATKLEVYGVVRVSESSSGGILQLTAGASAIDIASTFYGGSRRPITFTMDAEKVRIDTAGNVGIGTTGPVQKLHIFSSGLSDNSVNPLLLIDGKFTAAGVDSNDIVGIAFRVENSAGGAQTSTCIGSSYQAIGNALLLQPVAGNVGIGTTSPNAKLEVYGTSGDSLPTFKITSTTAPNTFNYAGTILNSSLGASRNYVLFIGKASSTKNAAYIGYNHSGTDGSNTNFLTLGHYASDNLLNILGDGNVGIGTTSPDTLLHVHGSSPFVRISNSAAANHGIKITYGSSETHGLHLLYQPGSALSFIDNTYPTSSGQVYGDIYFRQNVAGTMTTRMTIKADGGGNVGIGTTGPGYKLDVNGTFNATGTSTLAAVSISGTINSSATEAIRINNNSGYISIYNTAGTTRTGYIQGLTANSLTIAAENSSILQFNVGGSERVRIDTAGNVGIGTTTGTFTLNVYNNADVWHAKFGGATGEVRIGGQTSSGAVIQAFVPGSGTVRDLYLQRDGGNVGIGTSSPSSRVHIYENANRVTYITQNNNHTARFEAYGTATAIDTTASNGIFFRMNGSDVVKFAADGNVGIGTTSPGAPLTIYKASNPWMRINGGGAFSYIQLDDGTSYGYLFKNTSSDTSNGALAGAMYTYTDSGKAFQHIHSGTPLFTILSGGSVGIGTTAPAAKFEMFGGEMAIKLSANTTSSFQWKNSSGTKIQEIRYDDSDGSMTLGGVGGYPIKFITSNAEKVRISGTGNLGIGTTNPATLLHVDTAGSDARIRVSAGTNTVQGGMIANTGTSLVYAGSITNHGFSLRTNDTDRVRIQTDGNVGIGTTGPSARLHVFDTNNSPATGNLLVTSTGGNASIRIDSNSTSNYTYFTLSQGGVGKFELGIVPTTSDFYINPTVQSGANGAAIYIKKADGNVGIGSTSPGYKLDVVGDINFSSTLKFGGINVISNSSGDVYLNGRVIRNESNTSQDGMYIGYNSGGTTNAHIRFFANAANERMRIQANDGNVGIGTTSAGKKLDVEGIVRTRGASGTGGFEIGAATTGAAKWRIEWDSASDSLDFNWVG